MIHSHGLTVPTDGIEHLYRRYGGEGRSSAGCTLTILLVCFLRRFVLLPELRPAVESAYAAIGAFELDHKAVLLAVALSK